MALIYLSGIERMNKEMGEKIMRIKDLKIFTFFSALFICSVFFYCLDGMLGTNAVRVTPLIAQSYNNFIATTYPYTPVPDVSHQYRKPRPEDFFPMDYSTWLVRPNITHSYGGVDAIIPRDWDIPSYSQIGYKALPDISRDIISSVGQYMQAGRFLSTHLPNPYTGSLIPGEPWWLTQSTMAPDIGTLIPLIAPVRATPRRPELYYTRDPTQPSSVGNGVVYIIHSIGMHDELPEVVFHGGHPW